MNLVAKCIIDKEEIQHKVDLGFKKLEIQLYGETFIDGDLDELIKISISKNYDIVNVHMPLRAGFCDDFNIEFLTYPFAYELFMKACRYSQMIADEYNHDINIIIHNGMDIERYKFCPVLLDKIVEIFDYALDVFPNISFSIENITPAQFYEPYKRFFTWSGFLYDNVALANYLNEKCIRPCFYTTLDTCHAMHSLKVIDLFKNEPFYIGESLEKFFKENSETCNNIHLCNLTNWGYGFLEHGSAFNKNKPEDIEVLSNILKYYKKYTPNATLTLEVCEENYLNCVNLQLTRDAVMECFGKD